MDNWISVDERLPKQVTTVLVYLPDMGVRIGYLYEKTWNESVKPFKCEVTHWQNLPKPPSQLIHTQEETDNWDKPMDN